MNYLDLGGTRLLGKLALHGGFTCPLFIRGPGLTY
jgi:hypothetical protein